MTYDGELIRAETGETDDDTFYAPNYPALKNLTFSLKAGDTMVINAHE
jgi:hypothetical protein